MSEDIRLMKGNEAIGEAAVRAGCKAYFGYPITPQNELTAYMAVHMLAKGRTFIQAESEVSAINMVYGAAATGVRTMTSSSSPGVSLKQEGISYLCGADLPAVIINVARSGPGLGGISPSQGDYFQSTRGGGHGDYYTIVLAPKGVQDAADLTYEAFAITEKYRIPVLILADGLIGQMMEGVVLPPVLDPDSFPRKAWAAGCQEEMKRGPNHVTSIHLVPEELELTILERFKRYDQVKKEICSLTLSGERNVTSWTRYCPRGMKMIVPRTLNSKWITAAFLAILFAVMEESNAVIQGPMFAPSIIGNAI